MSKSRFSPLGLIIGWSLLVHLPGLTSPMRDYHAYRQCQTASVARNYVRHGMDFLKPEIDTEGLPARTATEFPIYSYLLAVLFRLFGVQDLWGRLLSCLFAAWGAVYLFRFITPRLGQRIALWSALVMCSIPIHIYFTRTVQPEPMALWGLLGFLYYGDQWLNRHGKNSAWQLALVLGALGPLLKLPFIYLVVPLWLALGYERYRFKVLTNVRWVSLLVGILALTEAWYYYAKTAPVGLLPLSLHEHLMNLAPAYTVHLWRVQFISRVPELVMTYSGLVLAAIGFYYFRKAKTFSLLIFWAAVSVVYVGMLGNYGLIHFYTLLPLAPIAAVWIACGISTLWEYTRTHHKTRILVAILILGIPVHAALRIKHWYRLEYAYLSQVHSVLSQISRPDDLVLVVSNNMPEIFYYIDRYGYAMDPDTWKVETINFRISHGVRYILIPVEDNRKRLAELKSTLAKRLQLISNDPDYLLYKVS